jgi:hypothetical protein
MRVFVRTLPEAPPWLTLAKGKLSTTGRAARVTAAVTLGARPAPSWMTADYTIDPTNKLSVTVTEAGHAGPLAVVTVRLGAPTPVADVAVPPVQLGALGPLLGLAASSAITLSAQASVVFGPQGGGVRGFEGHAEVRLAGFVPPHPREVDSILSGGDTVASSNLRGQSNAPKVELSQIVVRSGRLELKGAGSLLTEGDHATAKLAVTGPIPCTELAGAAAHESVGGVLGALAGDVARRAVEGNALVTVNIDADSRDLGATKLVPKVALGCRLSLAGLVP